MTASTANGADWRRSQGATCPTVVRNDRNAAVPHTLEAADHRKIKPRKTG
ncbi:hypothetical protein [Streptomyces sparsogenes]